MTAHSSSLTVREHLQCPAYLAGPRKVGAAEAPRGEGAVEQGVAQASESWGREEPLKASKQGQDLS